MKRLVMGILAHVDAGKTTLSEALLYRGGCLRKLGRVDHQDAFLDTDTLERERGITIFAKQARLLLPETEIQLVDTPGHMDFSAEMERTLQVLDYAVLVVSGTDGVQAHTRTVWQLLRRYQVPVLVFVNKMDLAGADRETLMTELKTRLDDSCIDFTDQTSEEFLESVATGSEEALAEYLEQGRVSRQRIAGAAAQRKIFPVWFGSALKLDGIDAFLRGLEEYTLAPQYPAEFGAKVYKIARDPQGARLTYLKVTGGSLKVKALLSNRKKGLPPEQVWEEKADQLRLYSGVKFQTVDEVPAGMVCAVTGLSRTCPGEGLGAESASEAPVLEPVLSYQLLLPEGCDPHAAMGKLTQLEEEDPQLHLVWDEGTRQIRVQLMGEIQLEVLQRVIAERFGWQVAFGEGSIVYKETIASTVEGIGHFEPLRHYAEVHLLLEPGEQGSGLQLESACPEDQLDRSWQRLIFTHLQERDFPGVLTGSPVTDLRITLLTGRAHIKHTEGGDFRQATYRAVRQGLMQAESVLLEPWYDVRLELPADCVGRAMSDLQMKAGRLQPPELNGEEAVLTGSVPVVELRTYAAELAAYTRGRGRMLCTLRGYEPCHNAEEVIAAIGYDAERDAENPADSVFCAHGGGYLVPWYEVVQHAHVSSGRGGTEEPQPERTEPRSASRSARTAGTFEEDQELRAIFERTYGPVRQRRGFDPQAQQRRQETERKRAAAPQPAGPEYLLVDGYNIIYAWDELKDVARDNLDAARKLLMDLLSNYQGFRKNHVILVFDAYKVPHQTGEVSRYGNITVVYTKESQTADAYIEKATYELGRDNRVRVATSDGAEQLIILGHGALRIPASAFHEEVESVEGQIAAIVHRNNSRGGKNRQVQAAMEAAQLRKRKPE